MISKWPPRSSVITNTDRFCNFIVKPPNIKNLVNHYRVNVNLIISHKYQVCRNVAILLTLLVSH